MVNVAVVKSQAKEAVKVVLVVPNDEAPRKNRKNRKNRKKAVNQK